MSGSTGCPVFFLFFLFGLGPFGKSRVACCCLGPRPRLMLQPPYYTRLCPATVDAYRLSLSLTVIHAYTRTTFPHSFLSLSLSLSFFLYLFPFCHIIRPSVARWTFLPRSKRFHLRSLVSSLHSRREIKKKTGIWKLVATRRVIVSMLPLTYVRT